MRIGSFTPPASWGTRSQIGGTVAELKDVLGNQDGLWHNEARAAGTAGDVLDRNPLASKLARFAGVGASVDDEMKLLAAFTAEREATWGRKVTELDVGALRGGELFAAQKAIALTRYGRTPNDVTEGFVKASGSVAGEAIAPREVFWQRWKPTAAPSGKVVVVSPGFQETGRNFYEQIAKLNALGHDVIVMDHQWAGQTRGGSAGGLDRGFGVARDVAAVAAFAEEVRRADHGDKAGSEVVLFGNSMGAGPGVLGALTLNDQGLIDLGDGARMPKGLKAVLQAPFLAATDNVVNDVLAFASGLPFVNRLKAPSLGVPVLTTDAVGAEKGAQAAVLEDVRAQTQAMGAAGEDLEKILALIAEGRGPSGKLFVVHGDDDPLASPEKARWLAGALGEQVTLRMIDSDNHVLALNPGEQDLAVEGLEGLLSGE